MKYPAVYILASERNGTLYVGVTSHLIQRMYKHRNGTFEGFSKKYKCTMLVYYERYETMLSAIEREKQLKAGNRKRKTDLIEKSNPFWKDLYETINPMGTLSI